MTQPDLIAIGEAARYIGVSVDTLRRWTKEDRVPYRRLPSGARRFVKSELEPFIASARDRSGDAA